MYTYACTYVYTYTCVHRDHTYEHVCIWLYIHIYIYVYIFIWIYRPVRSQDTTVRMPQKRHIYASKETYCTSQKRRMYTPKKTCQESKHFIVYASKETYICLKRDVYTSQKRCMHNPKETCQESRHFSFDALAAPSLPPVPPPLPAPPFGVLRGRGGFVGEASLYLCACVCGKCSIWIYCLCASYELIVSVFHTNALSLLRGPAGSWARHLCASYELIVNSIDCQFSLMFHTNALLTINELIVSMFHANALSLLRGRSGFVGEASLYLCVCAWWVFYFLWIDCRCVSYGFIVSLFHMNVIVSAERTWRVRGRGVSVPVCVCVLRVFHMDSLSLCCIWIHCPCVSYQRHCLCWEDAAGSWARVRVPVCVCVIIV